MILTASEAWTKTLRLHFEMGFTLTAAFALLCSGGNPMLARAELAKRPDAPFQIGYFDHVVQHHHQGRNEHRRRTS